MANVSKKFRRFLLILTISLVLVLLALPPAIYFYGLSKLPGNRAPLMSDQISARSQSAYWEFLGGTNSPKMKSLNPYSYLLEFIEIINHGHKIRIKPEISLLNRASRSMMFRRKERINQSEFLLGSVSGIIWISRHWSIEETISTVISSNYYGYDYRGINEAASRYFGKTEEHLNEEQRARLIVTERAPSRLSLWCHFEENSKTTSRFFPAVALSPSNKIGLLEPPEGTCKR